MASDDATREAEERLTAALERIADMADQGLSRTRSALPDAALGAAPDAAPDGAPTPDAREIVARLDALIERLRAALQTPAP